MKIGDRIALKRLCDSEVKSSGKTSGQKAAYMQTRRSKLLDRLRNQTETNDETEDAEASQRGVQNKTASKQTWRIHIGWIHNGRQVRTSSGGGVRQLIVDKSADFETLLGHSKQLFFPCDISKKGLKFDDCTFDLRDFSQSALPRELNVGEIYRQEKPTGILRFHVITMAAQDVSGLLSNSDVEMAEVGSKKRKRNAFDISNAFPELGLEIPETILESSDTESVDIGDYLLQPFTQVASADGAIASTSDETAMQPPTGEETLPPPARQQTTPPPASKQTPPPPARLQTPPPLARQQTPPPPARQQTPPPPVSQHTPPSPARQQMPPPRSPTPPPPMEHLSQHTVTIHRGNILQEMISVFKHPHIIDTPLIFQFVDEACLARHARYSGPRCTC